MKETKTIQVYPDDGIVNSTISEYESFGWEVVGNQRCQEYEGQTRGIDGSTTNHYSTFNKITFSREKDLPYYDSVTLMEKEYYALKDEAKRYRNYKPVLNKPKPDGIVGVALGVYLYMMFIVPGIIYSIVRSCQKSKYKKSYEKAAAEYESVYPAKIKALEEKAEGLRLSAEKCVLEKV